MSCMQKDMLRFCTVARSDDFYSVQHTCLPHLIADNRYAGPSIKYQQCQQLLMIMYFESFLVSCTHCGNAYE